MAASTEQEEEQGDGFEDAGDESRILAVTPENLVGKPAGKHCSQHTENRIDTDNRGC